ncbi:MAG: ADP-forming succinate--CoA ligase subunit beta [Eubacteriales bacterium]|nr:ADP-forming succinate--CoA ligase subunit beta [Eubacteriales bacterium]
MRLFEYQAKAIFAKYGIDIPNGQLVDSHDSIGDSAKKIGYPVVLKAQALAGGRGKAGGIRFAKDDMEAEGNAGILLGMNINGAAVSSILVEEKVDIEKEIYFSITMDRAAKRPVVIVSAEGGMDIEEIAKSEPDSILKEWIDPTHGFHSYHAIDLFKRAGFTGDTLRKLSQLAATLYKIFSEYEAELVEINPLVITRNGRVLAVDGKVILDENGKGVKEFQIQIDAVRDEDLMRYVPLEGDVGILANGAGLTMMTMDVVAHYGGNPANFMEIGGELYKKSEEALDFLLTRKDLNGVLVNLFGAYARTDVIIEGILRSLEKHDTDIPFVFRVRGTGEERARKLLMENLNVEAHDELDEAAKEIVMKAEDYRKRRV